jgi:hypothetical protein
MEVPDIYFSPVNVLSGYLIKHTQKIKREEGLIKRNELLSDYPAIVCFETAVH